MTFLQKLGCNVERERHKYTVPKRLLVVEALIAIEISQFVTFVNQDTKKGNLKISNPTDHYSITSISLCYNLTTNSVQVSPEVMYQ